MFKQKDREIQKIYESKDYDKFITMQGNRILNPKNLHRIKEAISKNYLVAPICVNENYEIIDGQHRYEASKQLELPVRYFMCEGYGLEEIQVLNANQSNWTNKDYLDSYCELAYPEYLKFRNFTNKYKGIGISNAISLMSANSAIKSEYKNTKSGIKINTFKTGSFKCENIEKAYEIADSLYLLRHKVEFFKKRSFVVAFSKAYYKHDFNFNTFLSKVEKFPSKVINCPNIEHFSSMIEDLYNYRNKNKINLRY